MRRFLVIPVVAACLSVAAPAVAGQPNASVSRPGRTRRHFSTGGFANAESHYAGSEGTPSAANGNSHAVSQYDIACFGGPKRSLTPGAPIVSVPGFRPQVAAEP